MSDLPLKATLKAGTGYDAPWITVDGADPGDLAYKLNGLAEAGALEAVVNAANLLKGINNAAPIAADVASPPPPAPVQLQGWGQPTAPAEPTWAAQTQQPQQAPAPQVNTSKFAGPPHPEGKTCEHPACSNVLEFKKTSTGKDTWRCSAWRWNNGQPNGHTSEFAN